MIEHTIYTKRKGKHYLIGLVLEGGFYLEFKEAQEDQAELIQEVMADVVALIDEHYDTEPCL